MAGAGDSLRRLAQRAERMTRQWPSDAAALIERAVTQSLRSATGDGALSHDKGGGRATVSVKRRGANGARVAADGSMGVWAIVQNGTRPHETRARAGKVLRTPYGPRPGVRVRGVRPRRTFTKGVERAAPAVRRSAATAVREVVG